MHPLRNTVSRNRKALLAGAAAAALLASSLGIASAATRSVGALAVSSVSDRSNAVSLNGATLKGNAFIFLNRDAASSVSFYLDNAAAPTTVETAVPYDLATTAADGTARPLDTTKLVNGTHSVRAVMKTSSRTRTFTATFAVTNKVVVPVTTTTTAKPATTTSTTVAPTTTTVKPTTTTMAPTTSTTTRPTTTTTVPTSGTVTNGSQINLSNTGYLAWRGAQGQTCTDSQLTVYNTAVKASALGASATCVWLKQGITIDANITLNACRVDTPVANWSSNNITLNYCTINPATPGDWSFGGSNFTAIRSQIMGSSDGVRYGGSKADTLIENYIRTKAQSSIDHNDGVQMYGASGGGVILRNNIDVRPVGGGGGPNCAIFVADGAGGTYEIRDNYLMGGGYTLGLHESGFYKVTGNIVEKGSYAFGPLNTAAAVPGAFQEWTNNKLSDGTVLNP